MISGASHISFPTPSHAPNQTEARQGESFHAPAQVLLERTYANIDIAPLVRGAPSMPGLVNVARSAIVASSCRTSCRCRMNWFSAPFWGLETDVAASSKLVVFLAHSFVVEEASGCSWSKVSVIGLLE